MTTATARPAARLRVDALHRLDNDVDTWVATADASSGMPATSNADQ
jgi:hypothetical protein